MPIIFFLMPINFFLMRIPKKHGCDVIQLYRSYCWNLSTDLEQTNLHIPSHDKEAAATVHSCREQRKQWTRE